MKSKVFGTISRQYPSRTMKYVYLLLALFFFAAVCRNLQTFQLNSLLSFGMLFMNLAMMLLFLTTTAKDGSLIQKSGRWFLYALGLPGFLLLSYYFAGETMAMFG